MQVATCRSEFALAESEGELALQMYRRSDYAFVPPLVYPALAATRAARGDVDGANAALDDWATLGGRALAPYRLLITATTWDRNELAASRPFRPVGGRPVDLFTLPILCAQAEVGAVLGDVALLEDAYEPLVIQHRAGLRWCVGWPLLLSRLIAAAARGLGRLDEAERWCDVAAAEAARQGAAGEAARVDLERAAIAAAFGDEATANRLAGDAALVFDRLGMLPLHQHACVTPVIGPGASACCERCCSPISSTRRRPTCSAATRRSWSCSTCTTTSSGAACASSTVWR